LAGVNFSTGIVDAAGLSRTVVASVVPASIPNDDDSPTAPDRAHWLAAQAVAALVGCVADDVSLRSRCRHCGGAHGALSVASPAHSGVTVSLSRAPGFVVAVASHLGPIGIDIESVDRMLRAPVDSVALHPLEITALQALDPAQRDRARTLQWTRKEALLKATGFGLRIAPETVALSGLGSDATVGDEGLRGGTGRKNRAGTITLMDAPDALRNDLDDGGFTPVFADLTGWSSARHVGSVCVLRS
jgi:hypothetical protein